MRGEEILKVLPGRLRESMSRVELSWEELTEVRFRAGGPVMLLYGKEEYFLTPCQGCSRQRKEAYVILQNELKEMMEYISNYSLYAYEEEVKQGFLTILGGHRVGLCGKVVLEEGRIRTIRHISFVNIRIAHEKKGCAEQLLDFLIEGERICHTLIVSPPGGGKTTMLRDLIRLISNGTGCRGRKVGLVDERSEIAACYHGIPQNDIGIRTDVLDCCPKTLGIGILLRSMSPEVIAVDELGGAEDMQMIADAVKSGCSILATAHANRETIQETVALWHRKGPEASAVSGFERYVVLTAQRRPGEIEGVYNAKWIKLDKEEKKCRGSC